MVDNYDITKRRESTTILTPLWKFFKSDFFQAVLAVIVVLAVIFALLWLVKTLDEKANPKGKYEMTYRVYYTKDNIKTYTIKHDYPIECGSSKGTNYINKIHDGKVIETNAPIEVIKYVRYK